MSTSYYIEIGYNSGFSSQIIDEWHMLKDVAIAICDHPERIAEEAIAFGAPRTLEGEDLFAYAHSYATREDLTISFVESKDEYGKPDCFILQCASGGGASRILKEHLRRAFCRLVLYEMHRRGIEITIRVT
jgi:hypothetical protein